MQSRQDVEFRDEKVPLGQGVHKLLPVEAAYVFSGQASQIKPVPLFEKYPASQGRHAVCCGFDVEPAAQNAQVDAPDPLYLPEGHDVQPPLFASENRPAEQATHAVL